MARRPSRPFSFLYCLIGLLGLLVGSARADVELRFGIYAADKPSVVVQQFRPALSVIERELSTRRGEPVRVSMQVAKSYEEGVEELVAGRVDFSRFGPASYIEAKQRNPGLVILVAESSKGKNSFNGVICVRDASPIQTIADLKGKRFAFGEQASTIGRYLVQLYLAEQGVHARDLAHFEYLDRHDKVGAAVAAGSFDAGALKESTFNKLNKEGKGLRALAIFPNQTKPWIARAGLDPILVGQLRATLLGLRDPAALKALEEDGFAPATDGDYDRIRRAIQENDRFFAP